MSAATASPARSASSRRASRRAIPYLLLAPATVVVLVVLGYPMLRQFVMSFQKFGLKQQFGAPPEWVGFDNYTSILTDSYFWTVTAKSLAFCLWTAGWTMTLAIAFALMMKAASAPGHTDSVAMARQQELRTAQLRSRGPRIRRSLADRLACAELLDVLPYCFGHHRVGIHAVGHDLNLRGYDTD